MRGKHGSSSATTRARAAICSALGVTVAELRSKRRHARLARARAACALVLRRALRLSYPEVAMVVGWRDHTGARAAYLRAEAFLAGDAFRRGVERATRAVEGIARPADFLDDGFAWSPAQAPLGDDRRPEAAE